MIYKVQYFEPENLKIDGADGVQWGFPFEFISSDSSAEVDGKPEKHRLVVPMSRRQLSMWRMDDGQKVQLLFELGRRFLKTAFVNVESFTTYDI